MKGIGRILVTLILFEANIGLTDDVPKFNLFDNENKILLDQGFPPSKFNKTIVDKSILSEGCIINAQEIKGNRNQS
jgi:glucose-1-phosphate adenylyltransferase